MNIFDQLMQDEYLELARDPSKHKWWSAEHTKIEVSFLKSVCNLSKQHTILDLFCALGRHVIALAHEGYNVSGLDGAEPLITKARETARGANVICSFVVADVHEMPFDKKFDVIYSIQSSLFEAWRTPEEICRMLKCIYAVLRPQGQYLFGWPNNWTRSDIAEQKWRRKLAQAEIREFDGSDLPFHFYGFNEQVELLTQVGFKIKNIFNTYASCEPFDELKPGLIMLGTK